MRHRIAGTKLSRRTNAVKGLYRGLVLELLKRGRIETTAPKAKAVVGMVDKVIGLGKVDSIHNRRQVIKILGGDQILKALFSEIAPRFQNRNSGYTRQIKLGKRGDQAEMVIFELVEQAVPVEIVSPSEVKKNEEPVVVEGETVKEEKKAVKKPRTVKKTK